jgi:hypothetical protein
MNITSASNIVTIEGNIKSVGDYQIIKTTLDKVASEYTEININIKDSISITSSVIGYFNKLVLKDKITLHINVANKQLLELFDDLNLTSLFKVKVL